MLTIDGSQGEGGGQVLRTSLGLSALTGQPFRMVKIRAGRSKPGLQRQHLTCVEAATAVATAETNELHLGAQELVFRPRALRPGVHRFAVGTAGSSTLVLQTVLPALLTGSITSELTLEGGTHNPLAPSFDFLAGAFAPLVNRLGATLELSLDRPGFFPKGGGRFVARIVPTSQLTGFELMERGAVHGIAARSLVMGLPLSVADRELKLVARGLSLPPEALHIEEAKGKSTGNALSVVLASEHVTEVITSLGERGLPAEVVAQRAVDEARSYLAHDAPVGEHLADQLLLLLALARFGSFITVTPSLHTRTQVDVIRSFLDVDLELRELSPNRWLVQVR